MPANVETIDRILDELETCAASGSGTAKLVEHVLEQLLASVEASAVVCFARVSSSWTILGEVGDEPSVHLLASEFWHRQHNSQVEVGAASSATRTLTLKSERVVEGQVDGAYWLGVPIVEREQLFGWLLIAFPCERTATSGSALQEVASAFARVIGSRLFSDADTHIAGEWNLFEALLCKLANTENRENAARYLVNGLVAALPASRVSLVNGSRRLPQQQRTVVSGVEEVDSRSPVVDALRDFAFKVQAEQRSILESCSARDAGDSISEASSLFPQRLALPLCADLVQEDVGSKQEDKTLPVVIEDVLVVEFESREHLVAGVGKLSRFLPLVEAIWTREKHWWALPNRIRRRTRHRLKSQRKSFAVWGKRIAVLIAAAAVIVWLFFPSELCIDASGVLEPVNSRVVYASESGFIDRVAIEPLAQVKAGDVLLTIRSPQLELATEEVSGARRVLTQELAGIRVTVNQLSGSDSELERSRLTGRIAEIELELESLGRQFDLLETRRLSLQLRSPIDGSVLLREPSQTLDQVPVQQGDPILDVMELTGAWQARMKVADEDTRYVYNYYRSESLEAQPEVREIPKIELVLLSEPSAPMLGEVKWIGDQVETDGLLENYVEVHVDVVDDANNQLRVGAELETRFACGKAPTWFVWSRPFVETIQRKFWLWTRTSKTTNGGSESGE